MRLICHVENNMRKNTKIIVFTDLDGSFLDHESYDFFPALPSVNRLKALNAPIIPATSKTLAEIEALNLPFDKAPQIAENGMVVFDGYEQRSIDKSYQEIVAFIGGLQPDIRKHLIGFNDMSIEDIVFHTSLAVENAKLAKERLGSELFIWSGDDQTMRILISKAQEQGLSIVQGGRFYHFMGAKGGKANAIQTILKQHKDTITIALGDGPNDAEMLAIVDYGIKIPNANGHDFTIDNSKGEIIGAPAQGPEGWSAAINDLLDRLRF